MINNTCSNLDEKNTYFHKKRTGVVVTHKSVATTQY
jgi:hypothetical protein